VVIEEFLVGEEASFIVLVDGKNVLALASSQDHKRLGDGDTGPNTGGMGAYSPAPVVTPNVHAKAMHEIILPTVAGMAKDGIPFTGFLYAGLMIDARGRPKTLEFNTRMGDPETQPILMRLKSDLVDVLMHATDGTLDKVELEWDRRVALGVVMAAAGYPMAPRKGDAITGLPVDTDDAVVFHAGTTLEADGTLRVSGGRVLCVTALGDSVKLAQQQAYDTLRSIHFDGAQARRDIGHRAIKR
jgi:phosphoribosylamine--glycine ligase